MREEDEDGVRRRCRLSCPLYTMDSYRRNGAAGAVAGKMPGTGAACVWANI